MPHQNDFKNILRSRSKWTREDADLEKSGRVLIRVLKWCSDVNDSQALTGGDITKYREPVARISFLSKDRPDLKFVSMLMPVVADLNLVQRIRRYFMGRPRAECLFHGQQRGELEMYSDADW